MDPMERVALRFDSSAESSAWNASADALRSFRLGSRKEKPTINWKKGWKKDPEWKIPFQWEEFRFHGWKMLLPLEDAAVTRLQRLLKASTMLPKPTEAYKPVGRPPEAYSHRGRGYGAYMEEDPRIQTFERFQAKAILHSSS
jgi:hypothetical protein